MDLVARIIMSVRFIEVTIRVIARKDLLRTTRRQSLFVDVLINVFYS